MATIESPKLDPVSIIVEKQEETILFADLLDKNEDGTDCITDENLDFIWPRDQETQPSVVVGKAFVMPPACDVPFISCEEKFGRDVCISFVFDGPSLPPVPLSSSGIFLVIAFVALFINKVST